MFKTTQRLLISNKYKMSTFTQRLNRITGQMCWVLQDENYDYHQEVARAAYGDMLHDYERNQKYEAALKIAIDHMHSLGKKANVLDIGTGTGLLSMMAVRHGADSVVACEAFKPMCECARKVIATNDYADKIKIISKRSTEIDVVKDIGFKANILVTEVFDTELIGEGAYSTFKGAHDHLLEEDCIVVPHAARMFIQIVDSPYINNWSRLKDVYNDDGKLLLKAPKSIALCKGEPSVHDIQLSRLNQDLFNTIISPMVVFEFDWTNKNLIFERVNVTEVVAEATGTANAVFMWWELDMDIHNNILLSCAPHWAHPDGSGAPWRDHWMQAIYYLPRELNVTRGERLNVIGAHDEYSLWFNLVRNQPGGDDLKKPFCTCDLHQSFSRTRIGQLNDARRTKKLINVIKRHVNKESSVLVLGGSFFHALAAVKFGARKVVYTAQSWSGKTSLIESFVKENQLDNVEILNKDELLDLDLKFNLVVAEPFFTTGIVPWDHLQFVYQCKTYKNLFEENVTLIPKRAVVRGVAVQFDHLYKIRAPLVTCEGFKMKDFDDLIESASNIADDLVEPEPLWEYPGKALSEIVDIAVMDLCSLAHRNVFTNGCFDVKGNGKCNGIALWVDWIMDDDVVITTGTERVTIDKYIEWNAYNRQGVHLIKPRELPCSIKFTFEFEHEAGTIKFKLNN